MKKRGSAKRRVGVHPRGGAPGGELIVDGSDSAQYVRYRTINVCVCQFFWGNTQLEEAVQYVCANVPSLRVCQCFWGNTLLKVKEAKTV